MPKHRRVYCVFNVHIAIIDVDSILKLHSHAENGGSDILPLIIEPYSGFVFIMGHLNSLVVDDFHTRVMNGCQESNIPTFIIC